MSETTQTTVDWVDLSEHGLGMAVCTMGENRFLGVAGIADETDANVLERMGFTRVSDELWLRDGDEVDLESFIQAFPRSQRVVVEREDFLQNNVIALPNPEEEKASQREAEEQKRKREEARRDRKAKLDALLNISRRLGSNHLGQEVWTADNDSRFVLKREKNGDFSLMPENEKLNPGLFLRASTPAAIEAATDGVVAALANGETMRFEDFRYLAGALLSNGMPLEENDPRLAQVDEWIDAASARWLGKRLNRSSRELFAGAQKIHESRAYRLELIRRDVIKTELTLPIALVMQKVLGGSTELTGKDVVAIGHPALGAFVPEGTKVHAYSDDMETMRSILSSVRRASSAKTPQDARPEQVFAYVASPHLGRSEEPIVLDGIAIHRSDIIEAVKMLEGRLPDGRAVLALKRGGEKDFKEFNAFQNWAAKRWGIEGTAEISAGLLGASLDANKIEDVLLISIGMKRPDVLEKAPDVALKIEKIEDHASLWTWASAVTVNRAKIENLYTDTPEAGEVQSKALEENKFQSPYVSLSRLGVATTMVPRNLEAATREGLSRIAEAHPDHDTWVCNKLGMTKEEIVANSKFSPEQIDAIAMVMRAWERKRGALVADMTGLGKGRVMAGIALSAIREGRKVLFITERPLGFGEILRDFQDIGGYEELAPFSLNAGVNIKDDNAPEIPGVEKPSLLTTPDKRIISQVLESGQWPEGFNIVFSTYSQFNRPGVPKEELKRKTKKEILAERRAAREVLRDRQRRNAELHRAGIGLYVENAAALERELVDEGEIPDNDRIFGMDDEDEAEDADMLVDDGDPNAPPAEDAAEDVERAENSRIPEGVSPKSWWLRQMVDENTVLILDESHNAASSASQIGANIAEAVRKAGDVLYSSATWAKGAKNLGIYYRLFPRDFDTSNLTEVINKGGDDMHSILTNMLVRDGVMIARQHDLSQCKFEALFDDEHKDRNNEYLARLAPILSEMAFMCGDIERRLNSINATQTRELMERYRGDEDRVRRSMKKMGLRTVAFGSPLYQLTKLCTASLLIDVTAKSCIEDLENGRKPLVFTENTIQGLMSEMQAANEENGRIPDFKDLLKRVVVQLSKVKKSGKKKGEMIEVEDPFKPSQAEILSDRIAAAMREKMSEALLADPDPEEMYPPEIGPDGIPIPDEIRAPWKMEIYNLLTQESNALAEREGIVAGGRREEAMDDLAAAVQEIRELVGAMSVVRSDNVEILRGFPMYLPPTPARYRHRINAMIDRLPPLPASAIDEIRERVENEGKARFERGEIERPWKMGEITGRSLEVREGKIQTRERKSKFEIRNEFNNGEIDGLIINAAGATSVSLHAGRRMKDQKQRVMYMLQQHADIMKFVQAIGRIYRFDQVVGPIIRTPMLSMPAHERLLAIQNVKLRRLSANMQSSKEHPAAFENIADIMNPVGDKVIMSYAEDHPDILKRLAMDLNEMQKMEEANANNQGDAARDADSKDNDYMAHRFLARLIMLPPALQVRVLDDIRNLYAATIQELTDKGENPLETRLVKGTVTVREASVYIDNSDPESDSVFNEPVILKKVNIEHHEDPLRSHDIGPLLDAGMAAYTLEGLEHLRDHLIRNRERHIAGILLPGQTEAEALAANGFAAKSIHRLNTLIDALEKCRPGMVVRMEHEGIPVEALIVSIQAPKESENENAKDGKKKEGVSEFSAVGYKVFLAIPGTFRVIQRRLSTLLGEPNFSFVGSIEGELGGLPAVDMDKVLEKFDNALEGQRIDRRVLLGGNMWGAMQAMHDHGLGYPVSYVGQDGKRELAVMVLKRAEALDFLPIRMSGPERGTAMAADLLLEGKVKLSMVRTVGAHKDLNDKKSSPLQVIYNKKKSIVKFSFPDRFDPKNGWIRDVPEVKKLLERLGEPDPSVKEGHWLEARDCILVKLKDKTDEAKEEARREIKAILNILLDARLAPNDPGLAMFAPPTCAGDIKAWKISRGLVQEIENVNGAPNDDENPDPVARLVA